MRAFPFSFTFSSLAGPLGRIAGCGPLVLAAALAVADAAGAVGNGKNVLFIVADDLNVALGCYGNPVVQTPNIDRLAGRGVRFDRAYVQAPLCNPSRVSFLSGLRPDTTGVLDLKTPPRTHLEKHVFLPQHFRNSGYRTAMVGKVYHTGERFEDPRSWDIEIREKGKSPDPADVVEGFNASGLPWKTDHSWGWQKLKLADAQTPDGMVAREAVRILEEKRAPGQPLFLAVGFRRPHTPWAVPAPYFERYPPAKMQLPQEPADHIEAIPLAAWTYPPKTPRTPPDRAREAIASYYACVSYVDNQVGVLLEALDRNRLWENTVVVFVGDHGYHLGEHGDMWHKQSLFEQSARAPMIVVAPGRKAGAVAKSPVEFLDLYPTLAHLTGLPIPAGLHGASLDPLLSNPAAEWDRPAYSQIQRDGFMGRSVRTKRWRYTEWDDGRRGAQLYDHERDPGEFANLAADPKYAETVAGLRVLLRKPVVAVR